jgi:hypothetical protein
MKYVKLTTVFLAFCVIVFPSFTKENASTQKKVVSTNPHVELVYKSVVSAKKNIDLTLYVWFDAYNDFLELNLIDDECSWTGYDQFYYAPFTVQEKGYTIVHVYDLGFGLYAPINPYCPDKILFSHP